MLFRVSEIYKLTKIRDGLVQKPNKDIYDLGFYNGIEMCLSVLENRDPDYIYKIGSSGFPEENTEKPLQRTKIKEMVKNDRA